MNRIAIIIMVINCVSICISLYAIYRAHSANRELIERRDRLDREAIEWQEKLRCARIKGKEIAREMKEYWDI